MNRAETKDYVWERQPDAAEFVQRLAEQAARQNERLGHFASRLLSEAGTRLIDLVDHFVLPSADPFVAQLPAAGFEKKDAVDGETWEHPGALLPRIRIESAAKRRVTIKVESVSDFLAAQAIDERTPIEGPLGSAIRRAGINVDSLSEFWVIERHGERGFVIDDDAKGGQSAEVLRQYEHFRRRRRSFPDFCAGFEHAHHLVARACAALNVDRACDLFFRAEREYWQHRNRAAQMQKLRQDRLGIGWANHDHHTYRSSRECFSQLVGVLEALGFECRERFFAGREAGWGAQVLEQTACGIVIFADVDLSPDEVAGDFAHEPLPSRDEMGTVGLWCQLHGEAFLEAGLHHLECQFDFQAATRQLAEDGIARMAPFTDFEHLKQAFTTGEKWPVADERLAKALAKGWINDEQAALFRRDGAIGSHLEILERNDGYKGFNQTGISDIILQTDPRRV